MNVSGVTRPYSERGVRTKKPPRSRRRGAACASCLGERRHVSRTFFARTRMMIAQTTATMTSM